MRIAVQSLYLSVVVCFVCAAPQSQAQEESIGVDIKLRALLALNEVDPIDQPVTDPFVTKLGQALFFDRELSGNRDIACATCHHPLLATGDGLALPVGTGTPTVGAVGFDRVKGEEREFVPRNAPEVFNRGSVHWRSQFWDGRIEIVDDVLISPAGLDLPGEIDHVLTAQAMFPVTSRDEMRGSLEDVADGNEMAAIADDDFPGMWEALMARLLSLEGYQQLFAAAFPDTPAEDLGFEKAAQAIAAFEIDAFGYDDSPFDEYLRGDNDALKPRQKAGAILFYGKAKCASCHSGTLLSDQQHHNLAIPQLGPGKDAETGLDFGRFAETDDTEDLFRFRTPPLRNVAATGPWMHNGAYSNLRQAIVHHLNPKKALLRYRADEQLVQPELEETVVENREVLKLMIATTDVETISLNPREIRSLLAFLEALTVPDLEARLLATIPEDVPSGLLEDGIPEEPEEE